jgi:catechol 2,3-dioxygenase-like lactoylglutathione lyase family enzyme
LHFGGFQDILSHAPEPQKSGRSHEREEMKNRTLAIAFGLALACSAAAAAQETSASWKKLTNQPSFNKAPQGWSRSGTAPLQSQERKTTMSQQGRILGIGGIFFKSANQQQMKEWYAKHLGLADSGHGVMLPWREKDNPQSEQMTVWSIFPGNTKYFDPSPASFMVNYIVDDLEALLDRLAKEGVHIDPKRQDESYGRFAWVYDPDGNKIELWQPLHPNK